MTDDFVRSRCISKRPRARIPRQENRGTRSISADSAGWWADLPSRVPSVPETTVRDPKTGRQALAHRTAAGHRFWCAGARRHDLVELQQGYAASLAHSTIWHILSRAGKNMTVTRWPDSVMLNRRWVSVPVERRSEGHARFERGTIPGYRIQRTVCPPTAVHRGRVATGCSRAARFAGTVWQRSRPRAVLD